jgi:hypothetical protein
VLAWDAGALDKVGCPPWCLVAHEAGENPEDRAHAGARDEIDLTAHPREYDEDGLAGWMQVYSWLQPGEAAGVSVLAIGGDDHYLPIMSPAEARQLAAALVARAAEVEAGE